MNTISTTENVSQRTGQQDNFVVYERFLKLSSKFL